MKRYAHLASSELVLFFKFYLMSWLTYVVQMVFKTDLYDIFCIFQIWIHFYTFQI